ncbi:hypothetical protein [Nocardia mexicana]|nr:hypothetical protein [Nocardia mexicana]
MDSAATIMRPIESPDRGVWWHDGEQGDGGLGGSDRVAGRDS